MVPGGAEAQGGILAAHPHASKCQQGARCGVFQEPCPWFGFEAGLAISSVGVQIGGHPTPEYSGRYHQERVAYIV